MPKLGSGSKSEGSNQPLLQCSKVNFEKKYIYLGRKTHKTSHNLQERGKWEYARPMRPELKPFTWKEALSLRRNDLSKPKPDAKLPFLI